MLSTAWSSLALLRPVVITLAPSTASLRAISRPMPAVEPVTMADLLFRCRSMMVPPSDAGPCMLTRGRACLRKLLLCASGLHESRSPIISRANFAAF